LIPIIRKNESELNLACCISSGR